MSVPEIIGLIVNILQIFVFLAIFYGYYISSRQEKVQYFLTRNKEIYNDSKIAKILYLVQNGKLAEDFDNDENLYIAVNATLEFFNSICYVHRNKMIKTSDYLYYSVEIQNIAEDAAIQKYLDKLLTKSTELYLRYNSIAEKDKDSFDYYGQLLPFLSLQLYAYMEKNRCNLKAAEKYFNMLVREKYDSINSEDDNEGNAPV